MKKYDKLLILPAIIIIIAVFFSGFSEQSFIPVTKSLLKERTMILQKAYFGKIEMDQAEQYLAKLETYPLLSEDIQGLREAQQTDFDPVKSMDFLNIEQEDKLFYYVSLRVKIRWHLDGPDSAYISDNEYTVILKSMKGGYKLSQFEPYGD